MMATDVRRRVARVVLALLLPLPALAAQTPRQSPSLSAERTLFRLEDEWTRALVRRDAEAFERLLAPRFVYTENDQVMTRAQLIDALTRGADTVESAANEDMTAYAYGNTAVVTGWLVVKGRGKDGTFNRRYRYTDTWVNRAGRWQVIAAQDYLAP
jgi:ketosteroid isomerase-like protein